jgi:hypothetical protein
MPELPLPGYHQLSVGDLRHRVRFLDRPQLGILLAEEREHGARPQVVEIIEERIAELDQGAVPSPGGDGPPNPPPPTGTSAAQPDTGAEPSTPLRHGQADQTPNRSG